MIFVTLGSQKFQFNRLLIKIDELVENHIIEEGIFAQTGASDYIPKNYSYKAYLDRDEFSEQMEKCDIVITHGGTGAIIGAVKKGKKVIAVPRRAMYAEHVDDHQCQLIEQFDKMNLICPCWNVENLGEKIEIIKSVEYESYKSNTNSIIESIANFIEE